MDFKDTIDRIGETLTSASKDIAKKAKDLVDVNTVKSSINDQKRIIRKAYERIGEQYYKEHVDTAEYSYEIEFEVIGEATAKIKELNEQLRSIKNIHICPECGATMPVDAVFCSQCGMKLKKQKASDEMDDEVVDVEASEVDTEENSIDEE